MFRGDDLLQALFPCYFCPFLETSRIKVAIANFGPRISGPVSALKGSGPPGAPFFAGDLLNSECGRRPGPDRSVPCIHQVASFFGVTPEFCSVKNCDMFRGDDLLQALFPCYFCPFLETSRIKVAIANFGPRISGPVSALKGSGPPGAPFLAGDLLNSASCEPVSFMIVLRIYEITGCATVSGACLVGWSVGEEPAIFIRTATVSTVL